MKMEVSKKGVGLLVFIVIIVLSMAHLATIIFTFIIGHDYVLGFVPLFNMDGEGNVPAWFSSGLLMFSSQLLLITAIAERRQGTPWAGWMGLACIFAFLSVDEMAALHERIGRAAGDLAGVQGLLHEYAWVAVYIPFTALIGLLYVRFLLRMPRRVRLGMVLAGALYVGGAVGIELAGSPFWAADVADRGWPYFLMVGVEETLEMLGIWLFILAILTYQAQARLTVFIQDAGTRAKDDAVPDFSEA